MGYISLSILWKLHLVFFAYLAPLVPGTGTPLLGSRHGTLRFHGLLGRRSRFAPQRNHFRPFGIPWPLPYIYSQNVRCWWAYRSHRHRRCAPDRKPKRLSSRAHLRLYFFWLL